MTLPTVSWLDHSTHERDRALDLVAMLREKEARDELGIGAIRDTISDLLFPGTSTLHTRARYFLFIPRIYRRLEQQRLTAKELEAKGRKAELALCDKLLAGGEVEGVIGRLAGRTLKRLPSSLYWIGLGAWGLRERIPTQREYFRRATSRVAAREFAPDGDALEARVDRLWAPDLPDGDDDRAEAVTFELERAEAEFLADKVRLRYRDTLLAHLLDRKRRSLDADAPWLWAGSSDLPAERARDLQHAHLFSELIHGAALLYNLVLAEQAGRDDWRDSYRHVIEEYGVRLKAVESDLAGWDESDFWDLINRHRTETAPISEGARRFTSHWIAILRTNGGERLADSTEARDLVIRRERALKGRFARSGGGRPLELWLGASGTAQLNFRWRQVSRVINDIRAGLGYDDA